MDELIQDIDSLIKIIDSRGVSKESTEWYLRNNLIDYKATLLSEDSTEVLNNATRALVRFCTESMDWSDPLYQECCSITAKGARLAKRS